MDFPLSLLFYETGSHYVAQTRLEFFTQCLNLLRVGLMYHHTHLHMYFNMYTVLGSLQQCFTLSISGTIQGAEV